MMRQSGSRPSSTQLLSRARAGDRIALNALVAAYLPRLRRWATGRLPAGARQAIDTEDVVQDTIVAALRTLERLEIRGEGALQAYFRRALANRFTDLYRRNAVRPAGAELHSDLPCDTPTPLEQAIGAETLTRYEAALMRLNAVDREAVILRLELHCGYDEIARALHKTSAAHARVAVSRAVERLAREMKHVRP